MKAKRLLILLLFCITAFTGCFVAACKDNSKILPDVTEGSMFEISLKSYSGTAYVWDYKISSNSGIEYVSKEFIPENESPDWIGGGQIIYTFKAIKAGSYKIIFEARNLSESKEDPIESDTFKITIIKSN